MGVTVGPKIVTDGLVLCLDATNSRSYVRHSDINMDNWTVGTGGVTGFSQNGATSENSRIVDINPMGESAVVWKTSGNTISDADGGWNTSSYSVDVNYTYRFSIWVKRISDSGGGTFYFGLGPTVVKLDGSEGGNPYWNCSATSSLIKDQWYLYVGHCFYHTYDGTTRHNDTGVYSTSGRIGDINGCNIGVDCKWNPSTTTSYHRTYHYYCTDGTTQLQFYDPRMDKCDGSEPYIRDLLGVSPTKGWVDLIGNNNGDITNMSYDSNKQIYFSGGVTSGNKVDINTTIIDLNSCTVEFWVKRNTLTSQDVTNTNNALRLLNGVAGYMQLLDYTIVSNTFQFRGERDINEEYWGVFNTGVVADLNWHHVIITSTNGAQTLYFDGEYIGVYSPSFTTNNVTISSIGKGYGTAHASYGSYFDGYISIFKYYNRAILESEAIQNYNSTKSKFGK